MPVTVARSIKFNKLEKTKNFTTSLDVYIKRQLNIDKAFETLANKKNVKVFDSAQVFCEKSSKRCNFTNANKPLYFDDDHLNFRGSSILIDNFISEVDYFKNYN